MPNELQISSFTGNTLYTRAVGLDGRAWNLTSEALEDFASGNWTQYVVPLVEPVPGTGIYFGSVPSALPQSIWLLPIYVRSGSAPASTDSLIQDGRSGGLTMTLDWSGSVVNSLARLRGGGTRPTQLPQPQSSLQVAQGILSSLYTARAQAGTTGVVSVTVDGQMTTFSSPDQLDQTITFWENKIAFLSGRRRRSNTVHFGHL